MSKKVTALLICLVIVLTFPFTALADSTDLPRVVDGARLLTSSEIQSLEAISASIRDRYEMDVVILTVHSLDGKTAQNYADDFYDIYQYGVGSEKSGALFLLAMDEREWYISTCGNAIYALTDYGIQQVGENAASYLSQGNYFQAFKSFFSSLETYFSAYKNGAPIDGYADYSGSYYHGEQESVVHYPQEIPFVQRLGISVLCGLLVAGLTILCMRTAMNTKRAQRSAADYIRGDSFRMRTQRDLFLYSRVSKTRRETESSSGHSGGHSGGGSSVHHSSSGRSHGGGGGRF